ncbi:hypothetical protein D6779_04815, partial [Candidatus Parcubacteria bacterium]
MALLAAVSCFLVSAALHLHTPASPDVVNHYLPLAHDVLDHGVSVLWSEKSLFVLPGTYLWPAILGADLDRICVVNLLLGALCVLIMFALGKELHSTPAGMVAAFMFAIFPYFHLYFPTGLSEPPFYFFTLVWIWCMGRTLMRYEKIMVYIGAAALACSILIRGVWF